MIQFYQMFSNFNKVFEKNLILLPTGRVVLFTSSMAFRMKFALFHQGIYFTSNDSILPENLNIWNWDF